MPNFRIDIQITTASWLETVSQITVPIAEILSGKNACAWVSMFLYLKKKIKIKILKQKQKRNPGSRLEVAC